MQTRRWINQSQPQTLVMAVFLLYFNAAFALLDIVAARRASGIDLLLGAGFVAGGYFVANERKWGYYLAVAMAFAPFAIQLYYGINPLSTDLITLIFEVALVALLLHPQSRDYERIWFK